jgi:glyoxylase-like metal-dependent hydrolase (beta-lactamase superfamily II)
VSNRSDTYEVYALRYGQQPATKSRLFVKYDYYGEPDGPSLIDYYFWLVRNEHRTVLVDCGFDRERGLARNRHQDTTPIELLSRMGVSPEDVDHVVISHMHYDHVGNVGLFPNATFSLAREELTFATGPYIDRVVYAGVVDQAEVELVRGFVQHGRLTFVDGSSELFPGIRATTVGGHTPGQMIVEVAITGGSIVLASDAAHLYEEIERDRPFNGYHDLDGTFRTYELLRALRARPSTTVIPGHDPLVRERFRHAQPDCVDLTTSLH